MKKVLKFYFVIWGVLLILFNMVSFVSAGWSGTFKFTPSFWIGYILITTAFIGQFICTYFALKDNDIKKTFYNISLISTSYTGLVLSFVFGVLCIIISSLPYWIGIILCAIILGINVIAVVKAYVAIDIVSSIDEKVNENTLFIRTMTVETENLISRAKNENIKAICKKVYEAVRYSDPMSNGARAPIESDITIKFSELAEMVASEDPDAVAALADEVIILLGDRNNKCRLVK